MVCAEVNLCKGAREQGCRGETTRIFSPIIPFFLAPPLPKLLCSLAPKLLRSLAQIEVVYL